MAKFLFYKQYISQYANVVELTGQTSTNSPLSASERLNLTIRRW